MKDVNKNMLTGFIPNEAKAGTYVIPGRKGGNVYIYKKSIDKTLLITRDSISLLNEAQMAMFLFESHKACAYIDVYEAYKKVLEKTDEIFNVRGLLIKPTDINRRLYTDEQGYIKIEN